MSQPDLNGGARLMQRVLQARPEPVPGQSLPSYLETLAAGLPLPVPLVTIMRCTGLIDREQVRAVGPGYGIALEEERLLEFARITRLEPQQVRDMLLTRYDGVALDLSDLNPRDGNSVRRAAMDAWAFFSSSWICPHCVAQTRALQVSWRLPLHFACVRHQALHADTCPQCGKPFGHVRESNGTAPRFSSQVPRPGHCWNAPPVGQCADGRQARPCGFDLSRAESFDLQAYPRVLAAQQRILEVLDSGCGRVAGRERAALEYVGHLRSVSALLLYGAQLEDFGAVTPPSERVLEAYLLDRDARLLERTERRGAGDRGGRSISVYRGTQRSAALMAAVLTTAVELLELETLGALADAMLPLLDRAQAVKKVKLRLVGTDFNFKGPLAEALETALAPRSTFNWRLGSSSRFAPVHGYTFSTDEIPQLLWPEVYAEHFAPLLGGSDIGEDYARRAVSMALVKLVTRHSWARAAEELGLPPGSGTGMGNRVMTVVAGLGVDEAFGEALHRVARALEDRTDRTDYAALRRRLVDFSELPLTLWHDIARLCGRFPGKRGGKSRYAAAYVWSRATEGDWRLAPAMRSRSTTTQRELYRRFQRDDLPHVQAELDALAVTLAAGHRL